MRSWRRRLRFWSATDRRVSTLTLSPNAPGSASGTLYQYFPDKAAILLAAAGREAASAEPRTAPRPMALLRALLALFDASELGGFAGAEPATPAAAPRKPRRPRGSVVVRLTWAAPAWWLQPFMTPAVLPVRPRRR